MWWKQALSMVTVGLLLGGALADGQRYGGGTRYETSALLSAAAYSDGAGVDGASTAVLVSGEAFADALVASGYAGMMQGSVLLTARDRLPDATRTELMRLAPPGGVDIIGGEDVVSPVVEEDVRALGFETERLAGADRYATAARVRGRWESADNVVLASGISPADAVAAGAPAFKIGAPVLLTPPDTLPVQIREALSTVTRVNLIGGEDVISSDVERQAGEEFCASPGPSPCRQVQRTGGPTRAATAVAVGDHFFNGQPGFEADDVVLTRSDIVADALAGAPYAGQRSAPILFATDPETLAPETREWLERNADTVDRVDVLGSPVAVSDAVWQEARAAAGP